MRLIIESGATKTDFCLMDGCRTERFRTAGINLATMSPDTAASRIQDALSRLDGISSGDWQNRVEEVHFYGAGLVGRDERIENIFHGIFPCSTVGMESDLTAASRALWGRNAGIAAILGTGSNSCVYDGEKVVKNVRPCGYVLGDFGSGAALGRMFLADYLQGIMPRWLSEDFHRVYSEDYASVVAAVYKGDAPARYLASFAPYIASVAKGVASDSGAPDEESRIYASSLIESNFRTFIARCLKQYDLPACGTGVTGSFACGCREFLEKAAREEGIVIAKFLPSPMDGLIKYHSDRNV